MLRVSQGVLADRGITKFDDFGQHVGVEEHGRHGLLEMPRQIRPLADRLVEPIDLFIAQAVIDFPPVRHVGRDRFGGRRLAQIQIDDVDD